MTSHFFNDENRCNTITAAADSIIIIRFVTAGGAHMSLWIEYTAILAGRFILARWHQLRATHIHNKHESCIIGFFFVGADIIACI
jgi:hypothetical protein